MGSAISRRKLLAGFAAAAFPPVREAQADPSGKPKLYLFNIPAQSIQPALIAYAAVVGTQIIYDTATARDRRSRAVVGLFSADTALRLLISGTDLTILSAGNDVALVPVSQLGARNDLGANGGEGTTLVLDTLYVDVAPGLEKRQDYSEYGQRVRSELKQALTSDPRTARRIYVLRLGITIAPSGAVGIAHVTRSSGAAIVVDALQQVLKRVVIDKAPPDGMPQPIYMTIIGV